MKRMGFLWVGLGAVGVYVAYKYRSQLLALFGASPDVNGIAQSQYGTSMEVPGTIATATGIANNQNADTAAALFGAIGDVLSGAGPSGSQTSTTSDGYAPANTGTSGPSGSLGSTDVFNSGAGAGINSGGMV